MKKFMQKYLSNAPRIVNRSVLAQEQCSAQFAPVIGSRCEINTADSPDSR
jgi:hypothetical protein